MVANVNTDDIKGLLLAESIGVSIANLLIRVHPDRCTKHNLFVTKFFESFVNAVGEAHVEFGGILLLSKMFRLSLQFEMAPEAAGDVVLQLARCQMANDGLKLLRYVHVELAGGFVATSLLLQLKLLLFIRFRVVFHFLIAVEIFFGDE